ncbi:ankyrin repeat and zinc finger domain-containing protein 1 [Phtheirospermum japonicum]|uniref:Ankyrin repeat and zinc finger domain-containing protein 1 n=1 Tax=Phtheirospermum japonicum TaxID=374723 RepID=A0A830BUJ9_9LAMI|nr:ankyrin repeat and zinc finger domain-containing protein 1 [Phtheirospermum japonicum]
MEQPLIPCVKTMMCRVSLDQRMRMRERELQTMRICWDFKKKNIYGTAKTGRVSVWRCLLLDESKNISFETDRSLIMNEAGVIYLSQREVIEKLKYIIRELRDSTCLRIVLLARGGHFARCVFDGNCLVAHKTFHKYVIRAKAGKKQSSKDAGGGRTIYSVGASLRQYNELGLKRISQNYLLYGNLILSLPLAFSFTLLQITANSFMTGINLTSPVSIMQLKISH